MEREWENTTQKKVLATSNCIWSEDISKLIALLNRPHFCQIPCFETRSDGRDNFIGALIIAGNYNIPEVGVYFR